MKKNRSAIVLLALLMLLTACRGRTEHAEMQSSSLEQIMQSAAAPEKEQLLEDNQAPEENKKTEQEDFGMEQLMSDLVEKNYDCITTLFFYGNLPYDVETVDEINDTAVIQSDEYKTIDDIERFLSSLYTKAEVKRLMTDYFDGGPLYFEEDGQLCISLARATGAGLPVCWKDFRIENLVNDAEKCEFDAVVRYDVDDLYVGDETAVYHFVAVDEDGWKLQEIVCLPVVRDETGEGME